MNKYKTFRQFASFCLIVLLSGCASNDEDPFIQGYELGASDTAKKHYWMLQQLQSQKSEFYNQSNENYKVRYHEIPGVSVKDGVNYSNHTVKIKTYE